MTIDLIDEIGCWVFLVTVVVCFTVYRIHKNSFEEEDRHDEE